MCARPCSSKSHDRSTLSFSNWRLTTDLPSASEGTKQAAGSMYDVGNLTLFLAGNMSQDVKGKILHSDGSEHQL